MLDHQSILDKHYLSAYESVLGGISGNTHDLHEYLYCVANQNSQFPTWLINFDLKDQFLIKCTAQDRKNYIKLKQILNKGLGDFFLFYIHLFTLKNNHQRPLKYCGCIVKRV